MTAGASVEDKRADERRIKDLREFQRSTPANKRCFDCNEMMPQYICVDFNTFVCTSCSGIHREFGHRVKSISMAKFTDTEVKNMLKFGGNEAAQKIWRAKHDPSFRPSGGTDGERTRNFIRMTYIDKKWQYESPRPSARDEPQRNGSGKKSTSDSGDDFFSTGSSTKAAPSFDAFSQPASQENNGGFAAFGDFSSYDQPKKQQNDFDDFGRFDSPTSTSSQSTSGFGDFGVFNSKPAAAPPLRDEFKTGSFTLAPPPGSDFGAFAAAPPVPKVAPPAPTPAPAAPSNDFLAFSPVNNAAPSDPFGFAASPVAAKTNSAKAATPFDAFGSPTGSSANRSSFDAFGGAPTNRSSSSSFDAFGSGTVPASPTASFDAFGSSSQPAAPASPGFGAFNATPTASGAAFDAFGAAQPPASPGFDAFGSSSSTGGRASSSSALDAFGAPPAADFGAFASATSSSRMNSGAFGSPAIGPSTAARADPFDAFNPPRTASGTMQPEATKVDSSDPFAAFDGINTAASAAPPPASPYDAFGSVNATPQAHAFGQSQNPPAPFGQATATGPSSTGGFPGAPTVDPFAFGGSGPSSKSNSFPSGPAAPTKTSSFSNAVPGSERGAFGGFPPAPQTQQPPAAAGFHQQLPSGQTFPPHQQQFPPQMYQQQQSHFGQYPGQAFAAQPGMAPHQQQQQPPAHNQQQQWMQQNTGSFGTQFTPQQGILHQAAPPAQAAPPPKAPTPPKANVASLNDPFASLSLGNFGLSSSSAPKSNPASRGGSFSKPSGSPALSATSSFTGVAPHAQMSTPSMAPSSNGSVVSHFGASAGFGASNGAPMSSGSSRDNSFEANKGSFSAVSMPSTPSPASSFSVPPNQFTPSTPSPSFPTSAPSPVGSFSIPAAQSTPQKQGSFAGADAFAAFGTTSRTDSSSGASSNPFDMF